MKRFFLILSILYGTTAWSQVDILPITKDGTKRIITGFESMAYQSDETTFVNLVLWAIDSVCTSKKDLIRQLDFDSHILKFTMTTMSTADSKQDNLYQIDVSLRVQDHRLVYYISDMMVVPKPGSLIKSTRPIDKFPENPRSEQQKTLNDLSVSVSHILADILRFAADNKPAKVRHWSDIKEAKVQKEMTPEEVKLAIGKPQVIHETRGEVQWMYSSTNYVFFKDGKVASVMY